MNKEHVIILTIDYRPPLNTVQKSAIGLKELKAKVEERTVGPNTPGNGTFMSASETYELFESFVS
jgi:hypothetical protein